MPKKKTHAVAATIAGSDSGGGAGIQADIKTFGAFNVFGASVITSVTSQNSRGVTGVYDLPVEIVERQLRAVHSDLQPRAFKTGMLGNAAIVETVAGHFRRFRTRSLVADPVIFSTSGRRLLTDSGVEILRKKLLPLALLVTPNLREAEILSGVALRRPADRLKAARAILKLGAGAVLIKGGHARGAPEDFFYDGGKTEMLYSERIGDADCHGTGCVLSAAITAGLAGGKSLLDSVRDAKCFISIAIRRGVSAGEGSPSVDPLAVLHESRERWTLQQQTVAAIERLKEARIGKLIPEVQSNIGVGIEGARSWADVIAVPGRIIRFGENDIATLAAPAFGASRHVANIVLTVMRFDPSLRAVMNIRYTPEILAACRRLGLKVGTFDRGKEPRRVKEKEGSSLEWGTADAIRRCGGGKVPDIIYDLGGFGKEEMIRVIAPDVESLADLVIRILRRCR